MIIQEIRALLFRSDGQHRQRLIPSNDRGKTWTFFLLKTRYFNEIVASLGELITFQICIRIFLSLEVTCEATAMRENKMPNSLVTWTMSTELT